jgi:hypothetical protein
MTATAPTVVKRPMAGVVAATTGVVLWGCLVPVAKKAEDVNGIVLGFHRLWIGAIAVLLVFYASAGGRCARAFGAGSPSAPTSSSSSPPSS